MEVLLLGQTVTLKSGGTPMTIVGWAGKGEDEAVCSFFVGGKASTEVFPLVALTACDPPSAPFEQLETQFGVTRDLVLDINEDVRQLKVKDPHTRGSLQAAIIALVMAVALTGKTDLYRKVLDPILALIKDTAEQPHDSPDTTAYREGHIDFLAALDGFLEALPHPPSLPDSE